MTPVDTLSLTIFTVTLAFGQVCFKRVGLIVRGHSGLKDDRGGGGRRRRCTWR